MHYFNVTTGQPIEKQNLKINNRQKFTLKLQKKAHATTNKNLKKKKFIKIQKKVTKKCGNKFIHSL